jgi:hypothetical protein
VMRENMAKADVSFAMMTLRKSQGCVPSPTLALSRFHTDRPPWRGLTTDRSRRGARVVTDEILTAPGSEGRWLVDGSEK